MHKNTYIVVSILAVLAALVVGVNVGKKISPTVPTPAPTITTAPSPTPKTQTFRDTACGFSVTYEDQYTLMENASGSAILTHASDQTKSIIMTCQKDIPRPALTPENIETFPIQTTDGASVSATLYHNQSAKDGTPVDALIFTHPTRTLDIFIAGYGDSFNKLIKTIEILP